MKDFHNLKVWEKSHQLALGVYSVTSDFPKAELYGLTGQIRRACVSIPAKIAEGCGKSGSQDFIRFLNIAMGSASELQYELLLAHDLCYLDDGSYNRLCLQVEEVKRMLAGLIKHIKANQNN
jgi:four helix bundle protein